MVAVPCNREIAEYAHVTIEYVRRTQTKALQRLRSADTYRILEAFVHGQVKGEGKGEQACGVWAGRRPSSSCACL